MTIKTGLLSEEKKKIVRGNKKKLTPSKLKKENNQNLAVKYYLQGARLIDVSERIKEETGQTICAATISKYVRGAIKSWQSEQNSFIENHKAIELEKINALEYEYWQAWEQSKKDMVTVTEDQLPGKSARSKPKVSKISSTRRTTAGDVRFLNGMQWCIEKRLEMLGHAILPTADTPGTGGSTTINNTYIRRVVFTTKANKKVIEALPETFTETIPLEAAE